MRFIKDVLVVIVAPIFIVVFVILFVLALFARLIGTLLELGSICFNFIWDCYLLILRRALKGAPKKKKTDVIASVSHSSERTH